MRLLQKQDIDKVRPKFRQMVLDAWKKGEQVPYSVICLSDEVPTEEDIEWAQKLIDKGLINDLGD